MKKKISKQAINETLEVLINGYYHCILHILPENEEIEIFIKNTEYFKDEIEKLKTLNSCEYYEEYTEEYDFLIDIIKKHQYRKVK